MTTRSSASAPPDRRYALFCGHRGCGKSTELRRIAAQLDKPGGFAVVFLDGVQDLDTNNLKYADVLFAIAKRLVEKLQEEKLQLDQVHLSKLEEWFKTRIESHTKTKDFALDVKAGAKASTGLPWLGKLFASITAAFKTNSTYKDELRRVLKNTFSDFADAFNGLRLAAEAKFKEQGRADRILFVIDGTDRLSGEDSKSFFVDDVHQLQVIDGLFIYCAPIVNVHVHVHDFGAANMGNSTEPMD